MTAAQPKPDLTKAALDFQNAILGLEIGSRLAPAEMEKRVAALEAAGDQLNQSIARTVGATSLVAANDNSLFAINPADWAGVPVPERSWYIPGLIPSRTVTILSGDGGLGKSLLALQITTASALSGSTLGFTPQPCRALYLGAEDEADEFHRRLVDIVPAIGGTLEQLADTFRLIPLADRDAILAAPNKAGSMEPSPLWGQVGALARGFRPGIIVIDTSADVFGGDEIKRSQVRQFIGMLRRLAIELDCAVLLLSHPSVQGMQSGSGASGSTAWNNSVRSRLYLTTDDAKDGDPDIRILTTKKANYGRAGDALRIRWHEGVFVLDDGKPTIVAGLLLKRHCEAFRELLSAINRTGQRVAPTKGVNYAPSIMSEHPDAGGVTKKQFEAAMKKMLADGLVKVVVEGPPSKQRQRLILAAEDFGPDDD